MKKFAFAGLILIAGMSAAQAAVVMARPVTISRPITVSRPVTVSHPSVTPNHAMNAATTMIIMNSMMNSSNAGSNDSNHEEGTYEDEVLCDESVTPEECEEAENVDNR
ncbi:hypothetical protein phiAS5_ORF0223 [Aeromonas phage phiAS5]|uniref:Uncharacterized protein n=1 Tax=Aeromonas phage phiAS5 TaxID=879630 RepID=E1A1X7_9CAUD|nr:hypothetical protein phiAS5_ORF0223 [Aeromonas phage phiAS5]ADM80066.1 hypothetical protein phiAS5_ORF0223 [Aeromonas phage phiAS5]BES53168.1 hypothetical protein [Aeromonas phage phiWae14]